MQALHLPFSAQVRRYKHLAKKVNRLLKDGSFQLLSFSKKRTLLAKLKDRLNRIGHLVPPAKLKGALAGMAMLLGASFGNHLDAQTFAPGVNSPFGIAPGTTYGYQAFADLDGDGDLDLLISSFDNTSVFLYYENLGTPQSPLFAADNFETDPFGLVPGSLAQPILADFDNDGDLDMMIGNLYGGSFIFQENTGTPTAPVFGAPQTNPFGLSGTLYLNFAIAADLDGDGDLDLLGGGVYGQLQYFQNIGSASAPSFAPPQANPFGIAASGYVVVPHLCDLDNDGDVDLLYMSYLDAATIFFAENIGTSSAPSFAPSIANPFGINAAGIEVAIPSSADIDGDGDLDVFLNDYYGSAIRFFENLLINVAYPPTSADNSIIMPEDGVYLFQPDDFSFEDNNLSDQLQAVQITQLPSTGLLKIGSTVASINTVVQAAQLGNLNYTPNPDEFGPNYANFQFKVSDGVLWSVEDYTMSINVTPVNDAPVSQNANVTASKDFPFFFEIDDFPFSDVENELFGGLKIVSLPTKGSLKLGTNPIAAGQNIAPAQVTELNYSSIPGEFGNAYTSFGFQVSDGTAFSTTATMTINVLETSASNDRQLEATVQLSPNPVSEVLNIHLESANPIAKLTITVFDALGRAIAAEQLGSNIQNFDYQLNVSAFAAGFYFVKIESNGKSAVTNFVKK